MARKQRIKSEPLVAERPIKIIFKPRTLHQKEAIETCRDHDLTYLLGPAGTGKTHVAVAFALEALLAPKSTYTNIIITRPIVEAEEKLGALPGEIKEKVHPYMLPIYIMVNKMLENGQQFIDSTFEIAPLAYMRGRTFENCIAILDEAQNCTVGQLKLFMSRLGDNAKMIISGDSDQTDIGKKSGLEPWVKALWPVTSIGFMEFSEDDIVRNPLVRIILARTPKAPK